MILCFLQYQVQQQDQICEQPTGAGTDHSTGVCQHSSQHHQVNQADINDIDNISMSVFKCQGICETCHIRPAWKTVNVFSKQVWEDLPVASGIQL